VQDYFPCRSRPQKPTGDVSGESRLGPTGGLAPSEALEAHITSGGAASDRDEEHRLTFTTTFHCTICTPRRAQRNEMAEQSGASGTPHQTDTSPAPPSGKILRGPPTPQLPPLEPLNVIVVGAGIGGLAATAALRKAGHRVKIRVLMLQCICPNA